MFLRPLTLLCLCANDFWTRARSLSYFKIQIWYFDAGSWCAKVRVGRFCEPRLHCQKRVTCQTPSIILIFFLDLSDTFFITSFVDFSATFYYTFSLSWLVKNLFYDILSFQTPSITLKVFLVRPSIFIFFLDLSDTFFIREGFKKSKWKFKMAFAIRGPPPPPP